MAHRRWRECGLTAMWTTPGWRLAVEAKRFLSPGMPAFGFGKDYLW